MQKLSVDILICTINERINSVPKLLLPPTDGIRYVVSHQVDKEYEIPQVLQDRNDVEIYSISGRGLSINRNNAFQHAESDICIIADDDNRYTQKQIQSIVSTYQEHPEADIVLFAAESYDGKPIKTYPTGEFDYPMAVAKGYYPSSFEMTMRNCVTKRLSFNLNFGLGSPELCAGEEEVFMADAQKLNLKCLFKNNVIVRTMPNTTGTYFLSNPMMQITKGATFRYCYGFTKSLWRITKESLWWTVHRKVNPFPIFFRMYKGINMKF